MSGIYLGAQQGGPGNVPTSERPRAFVGPLLIAIASTLAVTVASVVVWRMASSAQLDPVALENLEHIGAFVAGMTNIAIIFWLAGTLWSQTHELALQRQELALQREVWERTNQELQYQVYMNLRSHFADAISYIVRSLILVLDPAILQEHATTWARDNKNGEGYLHLLLENISLQNALERAVLAGDPVTLNYVQNFLRLSDELRVLVNSVGFAPIFAHVLFNVSLIADVRNLINAIVSSVPSSAVELSE